MPRYRSPYEHIRKQALNKGYRYKPVSNEAKRFSGVLRQRYNLDTCELVDEGSTLHGREGNVSWGLYWNGKAWEGYFFPMPLDGQGRWYTTTPHDLFPVSCERWRDAVHVAQVLARRFNLGRDGRGRFSELAQLAEQVKLVACQKTTPEN